MISPHLLILADDLTGAADTAGSFGRAGYRTLVRFAPGPAEPAEVLALSTHSRHLSSAQAAQAQRRALVGLGEVGKAVWVYKKIDSTLRGHPGAELQAVMHALGETAALIAPAFPQQGRTTVQGRQLVGGLPLEETTFGGDSDLRQVFARPETGLGYLGLARVRRGGLETALRGGGLFVADAETEDDLRGLVRGAATAGVRLLCGAAGLAGTLQEILPRPAMALPPVSPAWPPGPVLVVAGSRHLTTIGQVCLVGQSGALVLGLDASGGTRAQEALEQGKTVVLSSIGLAPGDPEVVAAGLAGWVQQILRRSRVGGMVLTGGDIALAVGLALGSTGMWLRGEVEPGIPWGCLADGPWAGLPVATKAGGFGSEGSLGTAIALLQGSPRWT